MTWERFGYICRKVNADFKENETISENLNRVDNEKSTELYGKRINSNSWPRRLLNEIGTIQNIDDAKNAVAIYKDLNLTKELEEPMRFKRVIAYLGYISIVFFMVVSIYQLYVTPSFVEVFKNFDTSPSSQLSMYQDYWGYFVLTVSIVLVITLLIGFKIRKLFAFDVNVDQSFIFKYLMLRSIKTSYLKVVEILRFPVLYYSQQGYKNNEIVAHFQLVKESNMSISREMQELIEIEMHSLLAACEKQMKWLSVTVALTVLAAMFTFLASAYSPIFTLGEII